MTIFELPDVNGTVILNRIMLTSFRPTRGEVECLTS
jgi:hypothetical protein